MDPPLQGLILGLQSRPLTGSNALNKYIDIKSRVHAGVHESGCSPRKLVPNNQPGWPKAKTPHDPRSPRHFARGKPHGAVQSAFKLASRNAEVAPSLHLATPIIGHHAILLMRVCCPRPVERTHAVVAAGATPAPKKASFLTPIHPPQVRLLFGLLLHPLQL